MVPPAPDWLALLWSDSAFPAGGASHSGGLEAAVQAGHVHSMEDLGPWLTDYLKLVLGPCDLAAMHLSHRATTRRDAEELYWIDERVNALKIAREEREASALLGQRRLKTIRAAGGDQGLGDAWRDAREGKWRAHACCVWGLTGAIGEMTERESAWSFAYSTLAAVASSAMDT